MVEGYRIVTNKEAMDLEVIHGFLSQSYWASGVAKEKVQKMMQHAMCFAVLKPCGALVGFGRVVTDYTVLAYIADVFILPGHRGLGLSTWLVDSILSHPELAEVGKFMLKTKDAHGLYEKFGFTLLQDSQQQMELLKHPT